MIYATHRLYDYNHEVTSHMVVETLDGCLAKTYPFECEKHSMQWYDAIILSSGIHKNCFCETISEFLELLASDDDKQPIYVYGVTYDTDGCMLSRLM